MITNPLTIATIIVGGKFAAKNFLDPVDWNEMENANKPDFDDFIDVRVVAGANQGLTLNKADAPDRAFLLVCGADFPRFKMVGWLWGREALHERWRRRETYFVPRERALLRDPAQLVQELRRRQANRAPAGNQPTSDFASYWDDEGRLITRCWVCGAANAGWGFGVSQRRGEAGRWFCRVHKPDEADDKRNQESR